MKAQTAKSRALLRRNSLGAAMVEAAVVLPLIAGFYGLFHFVHAEYDAKLVTMATSENDTSAYASHACQGDEDVTPGVPNTAMDQSNQLLRKAPDEPGHETSSKILNGVGMMVGSPAIVSRQATSVAKWSKYERTVTSRTTSFCNEPNYEQTSGIPGVIEGFGKFTASYFTNAANHNR